jgi:Uma2 family endonuclease
MSTTTTGKLITAEEFFLMPNPPDGSRQELVRGVVITMPPPGGRHGVCCLRVGRRIGNYVDENRLGTTASNDTGFISERGPDSVRGPDVSFWSKERLTEVPEGYIEISPDLAVEVVSPSDHFSRINRKIREYLDKGVRLIWIVDPEDRTVTVYRTGQESTILTESQTLDGADVLPGFSCKVADLLP